MKLKMDKRHLIEHIRNNVEHNIYDKLQRPKWIYGQEVSFDLNKLLANSIAEGVANAVSILIDQQYTNDDFEKDMGLK